MVGSKLASCLMGAVITAVLFLVGPHSAQAQQPSEREVFFKQTFELLTARKYEALENKFRPVLVSYANNKISADELAWRFDAFSTMTEVEPHLNDWVKAEPNSYSARSARGIYHVYEAWRRRGNLVGSRTSDEQRRGFRESLNKAHADLLASLPLYARPVNSYHYLVRVSKGLGLGDERALLDAALKLDPKVYEIRSEYYDSISRWWGGSDRMQEQFVEECNQSQMSDKDKKRLAGLHFYDLAQEARENKDYKAGADYFYQYYLSNKQPNFLFWTVQVALEGKQMDLASERLNELTAEYPAYPEGFEMRAKLYEYHYKDMAKAIHDYLSAADLGASWSQNHMGWYYMKGLNVPVDYVKAKHYLDLAASQGNQTAKENLVILDKMRRGE